uniref:Uncharacterized protein n=1 Tax=Chromera velia CCMP2878 TaxID=1169474 RepID=A0A0G4FU70_9ALVE|eukprot:Cvel_18817.t1-p1 / transcript=Cvel_18817.t1 / gene=Cvel_18817 / organism=Chromera_velia_CCMP2878 / gene_product=hypothetical protein / transcript_product=hypothetical protein / location=Cvel_scaffold1580:22879-23412(-) / protein_length=178 / sequence_SO=supercontig / SO=protein_coding / is_pseudo=false
MAVVFDSQPSVEWQRKAIEAAAQQPVGPFMYEAVQNHSQAQGGQKQPLGQQKMMHTLTPSAVNPDKLPSGGASGGLLRKAPLPPHHQQHPGVRREAFLTPPFHGSVAVSSPIPDRCPSADFADQVARELAVEEEKKQAEHVGGGKRKDRKEERGREGGKKARVSAGKEREEPERRKSG